MAINNLKNIGLLGGSFDPPHKGHLHITKKSLKLLGLRKVIWAITKKNPLKKKPFFSLNVRKRMCKKLIKNNKKIELRFYEDKIKSRNSIALIKYLKKHNKFNIYFIMGSDNIISLHKWKNYRDIIKMTNIIVFSRKGFDTKAKKSVIIKRLKTKNITFIKNLQFNMSSTELKKNIINGS
jgi:nicotinate (nicotinamide) nucleotide adenylyltransferase